MNSQVLIIADSDPRKEVVGGVGIYAYNLAKYLTKKRIKVLFIGKKQKGKITNKLSNVDFIEATKKPNQSNYIFLKNLFKIANKLKLKRDTIIHAQRPDWIVPFSKFKNKKIVTLHGSHSKNVYLKKGFIIGKLYSKLEKKGLQLADVIISVSDENKKYYQKIYRKYPDIIRKFVTIPVGIDISKFKHINKEKSRKKYGFKKTDKIVVYVGRFEKEKNLKFLIKSCHKVGIKLFLVGNGKEEKNIKKYAEKLESNTIFHPFVDNKQIPEILACGDVFTLTSLYEGFPTVVLEALAAGLPVISTDVGGIRKLVVNGKTGFVVDENDIIDKIKLLTKNNSKFKQNCIKKAREFSWDRMGKKIINQYNNIDLVKK